MGLSRLDNFLKSVRGNIIYVDPNSLDATDSIQNQGSSLTRPFKTIQRALIESSRFSYQQGLNNDRFAKTTILLYPGDHVVDNRPGWIPDGANNYRLRNGSTSNDFPPFDLTTSFDLADPNNQLYKLNSVNGGVIIPRGTSIVGLDLRKTKIRPLYVPNSTNDNIERSCIFRVTGACYLWQFSIFDADPNGICYIDYTSNTFVPNFSHHKLTCFEYADGVNDVNISDTFQTYSTDRTDLEMYYEKVGLAYGQSSGRAISPDYPSAGIDIQPKIDEFRIVGSTGEVAGISSIRAGNGVVSSKIITVTTTTSVPGLDVDTPFRIRGITAPGYDGQFVVTEKISDTELTYQVQNAPSLPLPSVTGSSLILQSDTVTSASPYIFNVSLRSVFGMCGLLADGNKATGFKSMVVAQFTGIGLQKDDNAFVLYDNNSGIYQDSTVPGNQTISTNSRSIFKPEFRNFHIKAINDAFIQNVSVFAIGYAEQFFVESGGDMSITNSNSNFGAKALVADGFRRNAFPQDDQGYITHIIPPKEFSKIETSIEFNAIDVNATVGVASTGHLYLYAQTNPDVPPENVLEGYRIGARENDTLKVLISSGGTPVEYSAKIVMPGTQVSSEKEFIVGRSVGINSIASDTFTLSLPHTFAEGENIRILSDTGQLPDGIVPNNVYYTITTGLAENEIKIAQTQNDAINGRQMEINSKGGTLSIVSRVSDKNPGEIGHPIQFDNTQGQWFINAATSNNTIYSTIVSLGSSVLGDATPRTFFNRLTDDRNAVDTIYRVRYVLPSDSGTSTAGISTVARPPSDGFIIQESNTTIGTTDTEIQTYFGSGSITNVNEQRNFKFIANAVWSSNIVTITTELPHNLTVGSQVEILNIRSTNNTIGANDLGFNGIFTVTTIQNTKQFSYTLTSNPGTFTSDTTNRTTSLPHYRRKRFNNTYFIYRSEEAQRYIAGEQDGVYYLTLVNASNAPSVAPFTNEKFAQPVKELFPQINRDNPEADPEETKCFASSSLIGEVVVNDVRNSLTKETINKVFNDSDIGIGLTDIRSASSTLHDIHTELDHGLNRITRVSITNAGASYGSGTPGDYYNATLVGFAGSTVGQHATAKVTVDGSGSITNVKIMDGGSAYGIGNTLSVTGIGTTSGFSDAVLTVTQIYNNVGDVVRISDVTSAEYQDYNNLYRITNVPVGSATSFTAVSATPVSSPAVSVGSTFTADAIVYLTGESLGISSLTYNNTIGLATVTTTNHHGLKVDTKIRITGANEALYNGSFVVTENVGLTTFIVNIGVSTIASSPTGTLFAYREGLTSNEGVITRENENLNGRMIPTYAGITTTLSALIPDALIDEVNLLNVSNLDINIGDYLVIDDEIVRVRTNVPSTPANPIFVFRGVLGTRAVNHAIGSVVRRIRVEPIELRRHSIMRASGHTFEYVGYGPGNYSTAYPDKQDRQISIQEELLAQSTKKDGGVNFYTGMNDKGISYSGNKRLSSITGQEDIFDTPIQTVTGEDIGSLPGLNVISPVEGNFSRSIRVEGGPDSKAISEFNGPVVLRGKVTSTSVDGLEANSLFLQGDATVSRKYTVGITEPTLSGNPGDIVYLNNPEKGSYVGWVYTLDNEWYRFGNISISLTSNVYTFDQVGIATNNPGDCKLRVGSGTSLFCVDTNGVGIGTTANNFKLHVNGNTNIIGTCFATSFSGDGLGLTNLNAAALGWTQISGGIYNTALNNVGIGTSVPRFNLELGAIGTSSTSLHVNGTSTFIGFVTTGNVFVGGALTATGSYEINNISSGIIRASSIGIGTTNPLISFQIGTASTLGVPTNGHIFAVTGIGSVGVGTTVPRAHLDVEGTLRTKVVREAVETLSIASNVVTVDLSRAQNFLLSATDNINQFTITNPPSETSSFTIRITQDATGGRVIDIDDFRTSGGSLIPVFWPGGGVLPIVTPTANRSDIYTFKTFDGGSNWYGVVVGQNFLN
jgi:hypothetical protein